MDDGSSDGSAEWVRHIKDARIRTYCDGQRKNLNVRLNEIVALAQTPYFFRMDADDIMHPDRVCEQYSLLRRHGSDTVVGSGIYSIDSQNNILGQFRPQGTQRGGFSARHSFYHPTVAAKTEWFRKNPYSERLTFHRAQDAELWCRTSAFSRFINIEKPLLFYRIVGTVTFEKYLGTSLGIIAIIRERFGENILTFGSLLTVELAKLWINGMEDRLGLSMGFARAGSRREALSADALARAQELLAAIDSRKIPGLDV